MNLSPPKCRKCRDKGKIVRARSTFPCECPSVLTAEFPFAGIAGPITGAEIKRHFAPNCPQPVFLGLRRIPVDYFRRRIEEIYGSPATVPASS